MSNTRKNPLLALDCYKMEHMTQYCPGTQKVYSYLIARSDKTFDRTLLFGLQYYLQEYLSTKLTPEMGEEFLKYRKMILGSNPPDVEQKIRALCQLGYFPLEIKAVPEGTVMPVRNVLMTISNTHPDFYWAVGFIESLILKVWYSTTVASCCLKYRQVVDKYFEATVSRDMYFLKDYTVHDFGYRGDSSEESAAISGAAHLLTFTGSDTVPALPFLEEFYDADMNSVVMASVPASEHSVMCSFARENEFAAFENMLDLYPTGIVSIVSDTFDVYRVLTEFAERLKPRILARDGKVVFRPDSGNPETIICGTIRSFKTKIDAVKFIENVSNGIFDNPCFIIEENKYYNVSINFSGSHVVLSTPSINYGFSECTPTPEQKGAIRLLDEMFGSTINDKGYRVLNPKVGLIYGDGMYLERYERTLQTLKDMGYAASNLVIGVGGILRNHSRDTLGFAIKATYVEVNGEQREIEKDPITDSKKKSHKGLMYLVENDGQYTTIDQCTAEQEKAGLLKIVFLNGQMVGRTSLAEIKSRK